MSGELRTTASRTYTREECAVFRKTKEQHGGLSNMASGFPLRVNERLVRTSEVLYQLCRFPHLHDVQEMLITERSPMTAKMKSKPYRPNSRPDFEHLKVKIMRWCLRVKLAQNWEKFEDLLETTGEMPIVESSKKDPFWGAQPQDDGTLVGGNVMGRLLMELRAHLRGEQRAILQGLVMPPGIDGLYMLGRPVGPVEPGPAAPQAELVRLQPVAAWTSPLRTAMRVSVQSGADPQLVRTGGGSLSHLEQSLAGLPEGVITCIEVTVSCSEEHRTAVGATLDDACSLSQSSVRVDGGR